MSDIKSLGDTYFRSAVFKLNMYKSDRPLSKKKLFNIIFKGELSTLGNWVDVKFITYKLMDYNQYVIIIL
jgi:hypothetical protein